MSDKTPSVDGLMGLVRAYADQETLCVMRSSDEAYWSFYREQQRVGDGIRQYVEAMQANAYADGRTDEADENGAASRLIDAWAAAHGKPVPWAKAVEIVAIANKLPDAERTRLLALADAEPAMREETVYEKSARWNWPDGRPDL